MRTIICLTYMEILGMGISRTILETNYNLVNEKMAAIETQLFCAVGKRFRISSPSDVAEVRN